MSTGKNIKKVRKWREMTQSELGKALGIGEGSAGTRIAQYETEKLFADVASALPQIEEIEKSVKDLEK